MLGILGMLAAIAAASLSSDAEELASATNTLKSHIRFAQSIASAQTAIAGQDSVLWGLQLSGSSYVLQRNGVSQASVSFPGTGSAVHTVPGSVSVSGGPLFFDFKGRPVGSTGVANNSDVTVTVVGASGSHAITITQGTGYVP